MGSISKQGMELSAAETAFYARHISIREVGKPGQMALKGAKVLVIGAGGLGCPALQYLAAAGVGHLGIVDGDVIEASNLQRQILFRHDEIGQPKARVARDRVAAANPHIQVVAYEAWLDASNAMELIGPYDIVIDGTDNFSSKFLINDACYFAKKTLVFGSIYQFEGQVGVFNAPEGSSGARGPNYRDLLPAPPPPELAPNCSEAGVMGVVPGIIGCMQANEVVKLITGVGSPLSGKLLTFDALDCSSSVLALRKSAANPLSGASPSLFSLRAESQSCGLDGAAPVVTMDEAIELFARGVAALLDVRQASERAVASLGGTHMPLDELDEDDLEELGVGGSGVLVVYCESGARSAKAVAELQGRLGARVCSLAGGVKAAIRDPRGLAELSRRLSQ